MDITKSVSSGPLTTVTTLVATYTHGVSMPTDGQAFDYRTLANKGSGWCMLCNAAVDEDIQGHFDTAHSTTVPKPKTNIVSWQQRLNGMIEALEAIRDGDDRKEQIRLLDEQVIQESYLVRARLMQDHRDSNSER